MENRRTEEDLAELLCWILPVEMEQDFFFFIASLNDLYVPQMKEQWAAAHLLLRSVRLIAKLASLESKNSLEYMRARTGRERTMAILNYNQGVVIRQIYDYRKKLMDKIPELEQLFLKRL
jgi:hypothetical protein